MNDVRDGFIMFLIFVIVLITLFSFIASKERNVNKITNCDALYTNYMKTTKDSLWLVDNNICPSPAEVRSVMAMRPRN